MSLMLLFAAATLAAEAAPERIVIQDPNQVTDGYVRTDSISSFKSPELMANGRAWSAYDTVLLHFNLQMVDPAKFGKVKKATLRLHATKASNPKHFATTVAPSDTAWTPKATTTSPLGNETLWPVRAMHPNINYAMRDQLGVKRVITNPGKVDFDVTDIVERWLYQGMDNHGLLVTASSPIFGMPDAGTWTLEFASSESKQKQFRPALILEMEGSPPSPSSINTRALALFPSPSLPPLREPYYFAFYSPGNREQWQRLPTINLTTYDGEAKWLATRGVMNLVWAEGGPVSWLPERQAYLNYYSSTARSTTIGFCGHESNLQGGQLEWLAAGFRSAKEQHPSRFAAYYYRGEELMAKTAGQGHIDLLIQEGYTHTHKQFPLKGFAIGMKGIKHRIDVARKHGAIQRHIVMLGHICKTDEYHSGHELTARLLDAQIKELRTYAPEMPGVGFYGLGGNELAVECDRLAHKHFVVPAPDVLITEPLFEAKLHNPHIRVSVQAKAKADRKLTRFRWFVDNRLVAETKKPVYLWDIRGEHQGRHIITVHAIDSGWNRGASQIPVTVVR